jgi:hypothetical protein
LLHLQRRHAFPLLPLPVDWSRAVCVARLARELVWCWRWYC